MVKSSFLTFFCILFTQCGSSDTLRDGFTKVPSINFKFNKKNKLNPSVFKSIDLNHFYELEEQYLSDKNFVKIKDFGDINWIKVLQFYPNGNVREFAKKFSNKDPSYTGNRGIIYTENNQNKISIYGAVSDGGMTILNFDIKVIDDKIYLLEIPKIKNVLGHDYMCYVFSKKNIIPQEWKEYKAAW